MTQSILVLDKICPFAHRSWIALEEKKIPYTLREVSLKDKEPFFTETYLKAFGHDPSSNGKVPILIEGDRILTESDLISWYLAENYETGTQLIPEKAYDRLRLRWFVGHNGKVTGSFSSFFGWGKKTQEEKNKATQVLAQILQQLEKTLILPYALGQQFSLADILIYPWYERWAVLQKSVGISLLEKAPKVREWIKNLEARQSIKNTKQAEQYLIERFRPYIE